MGLDMYLYKKTYVRNWDNLPPEKQTTVTVLIGGKPYPGIRPERINEVTELIGSWRKANAIHKWFVENVQEGKDDCKEYYVSQDQLKKLLEAVTAVLNASELIEGKVKVGTTLDHLGATTEVYEPGKTIKDPTIAKTLLPTEEGFFFGGTDYNQYYYQDLVETKGIIEEALQGEHGDYYYQSSW